MLSVVLLAVVIVAVVAMEATPESETTEAEAKPTLTWEERLKTPLEIEEISMPVVMCEDFVEDRLIAPSPGNSAVLHEYQANRLIDRENGYNIEGYVDSQNPFGAMIRSRFTCKIQNTSGDTWQLIDLFIK